MRQNALHLMTLNMIIITMSARSHSTKLLLCPYIAGLIVTKWIYIAKNDEMGFYSTMNSHNASNHSFGAKAFTCSSCSMCSEHNNHTIII